ncbi:hypothetical protein [Bacillus benzoevorans]|uniref:Uncharacterized protein n=1 Tax=Bacillus benzoevorans TaxID=1456 RepID=A0A7X0HVN6_9BACI|nr:hypothetical protein [Bacillus benzoevorans]MBB6446451.1 hypothetical protein [Bacillus benzoevorans]
MNEKEFAKEVKNKGQATVGLKYGTIDPVYSSGKPRVLFDGEETIGQKTYPYLKWYTPVAGDRVAVFSGVILGDVEFEF